MEFKVDEMTSEIGVVDIERIVAAVLHRLRQIQDHEARAREERELRPAVSARKLPNWG